MSVPINDNELLTLRKTERPRTCVWTGRTIPSGAAAVRFETRLYTDALEHVWCSLDGIEPLCDALASSKPSDGSHALDAPSGNDSIVYLDKILSEESACLFCGDTITERGFYELYTVSPVGHANLVFCHAACKDPFVDSLQDVWNATGAILGESL